MMLPSFIEGNYFIGGGDVKTQWFPFYVLNRRATITSLKHLRLPFYSFVLFLGNNIWASKASYGLFDIYNVLTYVLDANYFFLYDLMSFLKILVSGVTFYLYIDYIYDDKKVALITGLCYALGSYGIYFTSQPGFLSFYSLAPLYFLGMEGYLKENKKYLFIITVFLLLLTNYYFFYAASLFSPVYFIFRYYNLNKTLKGLIRKALTLIGFYLVGVLLSGIVIIPVFLYIIQNERVASFNGSLTYKDVVVTLHLMIAGLVPNHTYIYGNNVFDLAAHTYKEACLFAGSAISILVPQFLTDKDKSFRLSAIFLYVFLLLFLFVPAGSSAFNGFSEPCFRWLFLFIVMDLFVGARYLSDTDRINKKNLLITSLIEVFLIIAIFFLTLTYRGYQLSDYYKQLAVFAVTIIFIVADLLIILKNKKFLLISIFVELLLFVGLFGIRTTLTGVSEDDYKHLVNVLADDSDYHNLKNYLNYLEEGNDREYYRVYVPYESLYWQFSHDLSIIYDLNGLMTYDSTYSQSFNKMRSIDHEGVVDLIDWEFNIKDTEIMDFLSTKYSISTTIKEIPFDDYEIVDDAYRGSLIVARNNDHRPLGTTYNKTMTYDELRDKYGNDTSLLKEYVICDSDITEMLGDDGTVMYDIEYHDNYLSGKIDCLEDSFLVLGLPYEKGWKIKVNGEPVGFYECNGGMMGFPVNEGHDVIEMYFVPPGFKTGLIMTGMGVLSFIGLIIIDVRRRKTI